jgi:hypothetical protein
MQARNSVSCVLKNPFRDMAPGLSILFMRRTTIGTSAALAWVIASIVWGIMPSSAGYDKYGYMIP